MGETLCCLSSSGETEGPSDRSTPTPETEALPPDYNDHGNPSNTYRRHTTLISKINNHSNATKNMQQKTKPMITH